MTAMTEEEARGLRCCGPDGCGGKRATYSHPDSDQYCIASGCMAWRWACEEYEFAVTKSVFHPEGPVEFVLPEGGGWQRMKHSYPVAAHRS